VSSGCTDVTFSSLSRYKKTQELKYISFTSVFTRLWSKKYPICIILNHNAKVRIEDVHESHEKQEEDESNHEVPDLTTDELLDELPDNLSSQHSKSDAGELII
jgi:hypothetical protein